MKLLNTKNGWEYWGVDVPERGVFWGPAHEGYIGLPFLVFDIYDTEGNYLDCDYRPLPPGHWGIHCDQNPTEEQADEVVDYCDYSTGHDIGDWAEGFPDYAKGKVPNSEDWNYLVDTAIESLNSLKKAKGLVNCIILKKKTG